MKGPSGVDWLSITAAPKMNITMTMGMSHQRRFLHRYPKNRPVVEKCILIFLSVSLTIISLKTRGTWVIIYASMRKRILVVNKFCPLHPRAGGAEKNLEEIFSRIGERADVHLVAAMFPGAKREERYRNIAITRIGSAHSENVIRIHLLVPFVLRTYLRRLKPENLVEDVSVIPFFTPLLFPGQKKTVIVHALNGRHAFASQRFVYALIANIAEAFFLLLYRRERIIVVSEWMREALLRHGFRDVHKILNGVDRELRSVTKVYAPHPTVLFLGRLEGRKGADLFLKTYPLVRRAIPRVRYVVAGADFPFGSARIKDALAPWRQYPPEQIDFLGYVSEEEKRRLLAEAWLLAVPSRTEGYGITPLEANATGTFVIANNTEGLRESVKNGETGILTNCLDAEVFARTIIEWLDKEKLLAKEAGGRAWAAKHDWGTSAEEMGTLINAYEK